MDQALIAGIVTVTIYNCAVFFEETKGSTGYRIGLIVGFVLELVLVSAQ